MTPAGAGANAYRTGLWCLAVTSVGWGLNWPAMKLLLRELPPLFARGTAGAVAAIFFLGMALASGQSLRVPRPLRGRLVASAFISVFVWMGFSSLAMRWLSVGQGALLVYTMPVWAALLAWPLRGQRLSIRAAVGLLLSVAGLWVLFGGAGLAFEAGQLAGVALALAAAVLFAFGTIALSPMSGMPPWAFLTWQLALGCAPMVLLGVLFEQPDLSRISARGATLWLYMAVVPMGLCYLAWFAALRRLPPATASIATLATPIVGVVAAGYALGEPLGVREGLSILLTVGGVGLALKA